SRRLATALASRALAELPQRGASAVKALIELLQITILLVAAVPLLAIVQPFMAPVEGIGIIVITIALMIVVVTRSARQMQGQIRNAARLIATALRGTRTGAEILRPGDILELAGSSAAVAAARRLLEQG